MMFDAQFDFGDRVSIDKGIVHGTVIGFCFYPHANQVQVSWWNNGALVEQWIADWRLTKEERPPRPEPSVPFRKS